MLLMKLRQLGTFPLTAQKGAFIMIDFTMFNGTLMRQENDMMALDKCVKRTVSNPIIFFSGQYNFVMKINKKGCLLK